MSGKMSLHLTVHLFAVCHGLYNDSSQLSQGERQHNSGLKKYDASGNSQNRLSSDLDDTMQR